MRKLYASLAFFLCSLFSHVQAESFAPLIEAIELSTALNDNIAIQLVDIRSPEAFASGHINGAISAPYAKWRGPAHNPGQLSEDSYFQQLLRELGLTHQKPIVIYSTGADETDFGARSE